MTMRLNYFHLKPKFISQVYLTAHRPAASHCHDSKSCCRSSQWSSGEAFIKRQQRNLSGRKTARWLIANLSPSNNIWSAERVSIQLLSDMKAHPQYRRELWKATHEKSDNSLRQNFWKVSCSRAFGTWSRERHLQRQWSGYRHCRWVSVALDGAGWR